MCCPFFKTIFAPSQGVVLLYVHCTQPDGRSQMIIVCLPENRPSNERSGDGKARGGEEVSVCLSVWFASYKIQTLPFLGEQGSSDGGRKTNVEWHLPFTPV